MGEHSILCDDPGPALECQVSKGSDNQNGTGFSLHVSVLEYAYMQRKPGSVLVIAAFRNLALKCGAGVIA